MIRLLPLALLLLAAVPALAQATAVVTATSDGLRLDAPSDTPVDDVPTALLTYTPRGQWQLQVLSRGEVPSRGAHRAVPTPRRLATPPVRPVLRDDVRVRTDGHVAYRVRGLVGADGLDGLLVRLSGADGLRSLESTSQGDGATVEAVFAFDSAADWSAWHARPETQALLAPLADAETALRVRR